MAATQEINMGWFGTALKNVGNALLGGIPDIIGGVIGGLGQSSANKQNVKLAREQMAFQERMSATEIQRRAADLKAAGLNPMLSVAQGGASSGQGARTEVESPLKTGLHSAMAMRMQRQQLDNMDLQNRLLVSQRQNVDADTNLKGVTAHQVAGSAQKLDAEIQLIAQEFKNVQQRYHIDAEDLRNRKLTNEQLEKIQPITEQIMRLEAEYKRLGLTAAQIDQKFQEAIGEEGRWMRLIREFLGGVHRAGESSAKY